MQKERVYSSTCGCAKARWFTRSYARANPACGDAKSVTGRRPGPQSHLFNEASLFLSFSISLSLSLSLSLSRSLSMYIGV